MNDPDMDLLIALEEADLDWVSQLIALRKVESLSVVSIPPAGTPPSCTVKATAGSSVGSA
ncbi:hypothetical protein [Corynebacterium nuruki]